MAADDFDAYRIESPVSAEQIGEMNSIFCRRKAKSQKGD